MPRVMPAGVSAPRFPGGKIAGVSIPRPSVKTALMASQSSNGRPRKLAVHQTKLTSKNIAAQKPSRGRSYSHMYQTQIKVRKATVGISGIQKPRIVKPRLIPLSVRSPMRSLAIK